MDKWVLILLGVFLVLFGIFHVTNIRVEWGRSNHGLLSTAGGDFVPRQCVARAEGLTPRRLTMALYRLKYGTHVQDGLTYRAADASFEVVNGQRLPISSEGDLVESEVDLTKGGTDPKFELVAPDTTAATAVQEPEEEPTTRRTGRTGAKRK